MKVSQTGLDGVLLVEPDVYEDDRGYFMESFQAQRYATAGIDCAFIQDNLSFSIRGTLRGLHYQYPHTQSKLVQAVQGEIYDVAVDIRRGSPDFGRWTSALLSHENHRQLFVPGGFAHGFCVLSETAVVLYKCDELYAPDCEGGVIWSDPDLGIDWPIQAPLLSPKDEQYQKLNDISPNRLPDFVKIR